MNIENLRAFATVAETLNFHKAAEKLYLSQSALSRQIAELEKELGTPLFSRTTRSVKLTAAGEACIDSARGIVRAWDDLHAQAIRSGVQEGGSLRIGVYGARSLYYIIPTVERLRREYPEMEISVVRDEAELMYQKLLYGENDFIASIAPRLADDPMVERLVLVEEYPSVLLPKTHPLAGRERIWPKELEKESFVMHSKKKSSSMYEKLMEIFSKEGVEINVAAVEDDDKRGMMKVLMGEGIGLYPSMWPEVPQGMAMIPLECDNRPFARVVAWKKGKLNSARKLFLTVLREELKKMNGKED